MNTIIKNEKNKNDVLNENTDNNLFFAKFNKSCLITYIGILFGALSMYFAFTKVAFVENKYIKYSLFCLIISGVCDMYDGKFARACKRTQEEKEFGVQLDSLADTFCFIAVPVVIMLCMGMTKFYDVIAYIIFVICGVSRLGYFNIKANLDSAVKTYRGLPVTSTAIIYPVLGLLHMCVPMNVMYMIYFGITLLTALLFVVNIKIPKLKGVAYIIVPILAMILITLLWVSKL